MHAEKKSMNLKDFDLYWINCLPGKLTDTVTTYVVFLTSRFGFNTRDGPWVWEAIISKGISSFSNLSEEVICRSFSSEINRQYFGFWCGSFYCIYLPKIYLYCDLPRILLLDLNILTNDLTKKNDLLQWPKLYWMNI